MSRSCIRDGNDADQETRRDQLRTRRIAATDDTYLSKLGQEGEFRVLAASTGALASENVCDASPGIASSIVVLRLYEICVATAASIPFKTSVSPADDEDVRHGRWRIPVVCAADCDVEASRDGALL